MSITQIPSVTLANHIVHRKGQHHLRLILLLALIFLAFAAPCGAQSLKTYTGKAVSLTPAKVGEYQNTPFKYPGDRNNFGVASEFWQTYKDKFGLTDYVVAEYRAPNDKYLLLMVMVFKSPSDAKEAMYYRNSFYMQSLEYTPPVTPKKISGMLVGERYATERKRRNKTGPPKADVVWTNGSVLFSVENIPTPASPGHPEGRVWSTDFNDLLSFEAKFPY